MRDIRWNTDAVITSDRIWRGNCATGIGSATQEFTRAALWQTGILEPAWTSSGGLRRSREISERTDFATFGKTALNSFGRISLRIQNTVAAAATQTTVGAMRTTAGIMTKTSRDFVSKVFFSKHREHRRDHKIPFVHWLFKVCCAVDKGNFFLAIPLSVCYNQNKGYCASVPPVRGTERGLHDDRELQRRERHGRRTQYRHRSRSKYRI